jgi:hypothetical protein
MVEESDIIGFLKNHKVEASLDEIFEGLDVPKYGLKSDQYIRTAKIYLFEYNKS